MSHQEKYRDQANQLTDRKQQTTMMSEKAYHACTIHYIHLAYLLKKGAREPS